MISKRPVKEKRIQETRINGVTYNLNEQSDLYFLYPKKVILLTELTDAKGNKLWAASDTVYYIADRTTYAVRKSVVKEISQRGELFIYEIKLKLEKAKSRDLDFKHKLAICGKVYANIASFALLTPPANDKNGIDDFTRKLTDSTGE